jgi:serine/threonine-protein kinase RsbW
MEMAGDGFRINLTLQLPRDRASSPVVRHLTHNALAEVGVTDGIQQDVELAVTEACANVLDHAGSGDAYDVVVSVAGDRCEIRVVDVGSGFDFDSFAGHEATIHDESGRGIALMHALMDTVLFTSEPESGTVVHLVKGLDFDDSAPALQLIQGACPDA